MKLRALTAILSLTIFVLVFSFSEVMGKGDAFSDPCRTENSTTVISARVRVSLTSNTSNLAVSIGFSDNSGGGVTYNPNPLTFDIPSGQTENTGYFTMSSASASMGAYNITASGTITDIDTGSVIYTGNDTEKMTVYLLEFTSIPVIQDGVSNNIEYQIDFPVDSNCGNLNALTFEVFDLDNNVVYSSSLNTSEGTYSFNWNGRDSNNQPIDLNNCFIDLLAEKADGKKETADTGNTSGGQASFWKIKYSIPDDLSGINLGTVNPTSVTTNVTLYADNETTVIANEDISNYNVVKAGTNAQVTLKKDSDTLFLFASTETENEKKYQVTITSSTGAGLDNAGNEWDMDSGQGGTQRKAVLKFQLDSSGSFLKWDGSSGGPEIVITNN